jgi:hypothetical protein
MAETATRRVPLGGERLEPYDRVAPEYYDRERHPTCANFREATAQVLSSWLPRNLDDNEWISEVGAGKSLVAEALAQRPKCLDRLVILDSSRVMLRYSKQWLQFGAHLILGRVDALPLREASMSLLIAPVGDPYNEPAFWSEVHRVLPRGGRALFTTPSYAWALAFRSNGGSEGMRQAEFELRDGRLVTVPSFVCSVDEQVDMIATAGLRVEKITEVPLSGLGTPRVSPKLITKEGPRLSVLTAYSVRK